MTRTKAKAVAEDFTVESAPRRVKDRSINLSDFPCSNNIQDVLDYLRIKADEYGADSIITFISKDEDYWGSMTVEVEITTFRNETEKEIAGRIAKAKKDKEKSAVARVKRKEKLVKEGLKKEQEELDMLKRLRKKYAGYDFEDLRAEGL